VFWGLLIAIMVRTEELGLNNTSGESK